MSGEAISPRQILDYLSLGEKLKCATRHCFTTSGRQESVAEHSFQLGLLCMLLWDSCPGVEMERVLQMCILHDMGEAFTGDIPTFLKTDGQRAVEDGAVDAMVDALPPALGARWRELYREMDQQCTPESRLYKGLDKIEALIQHNVSDISTWIPLEYQLNLHYADKECAPFPALTALRELVREETVAKIEAEKALDPGVVRPVYER